MGNRGLFRPAKSLKLAKTVRIDSPKVAKQACKKLLKAFKSAKTRKTKVKIKKATVCASNRAKVMATKKKNLSAKERKELKQVSKIYKETADKMKLPPKRK